MLLLLHRALSSAPRALRARGTNSGAENRRRQQEFPVLCYSMRLTFRAEIRSVAASFGALLAVLAVSWRSHACFD